MYQNLLVYISQTLTSWPMYVPTQAEPVNRCLWQPGWYMPHQGGKAGRRVFADCLTLNILASCTEVPMAALPVPWSLVDHGNVQHIRLGLGMDLLHEHPSLHNSSPFDISQQECTTLTSCWPISAESGCGYLGIPIAQKEMGQHRAGWMSETADSPWHLLWCPLAPPSHVHGARDGMAHSVPLSLGSEVSLPRPAAWSLAGAPLGGEVQALIRWCLYYGIAILSLMRQENSHYYILLGEGLSPLLSPIYPYSSEGTNPQGL